MEQTLATLQFHFERIDPS